VVLVHGSMSTSENQMELAELLAGSFTVHAYDRRGFGASGPCSGGDGLAGDVEDLGAVLSASGSSRVLGISAGAVIALRAALDLPGISHLAVYEPPLFDNPAEPTALVARIDQQLADGNIAGVLVTGMTGGHMGPAFLEHLPRGLLERLARRMTSGGGDWGDYMSFADLAPTLHHDGSVIAAMSGRQQELSAVKASVLLLGGAKSSKFLKRALDGVEAAVPRTQRVTLRGLNHGSPWNSDLRGKPGPIAEQLRRFFAPAGK
jgi:pimeloyl-ACP methyl ester carboxylesterase